MSDAVSALEGGDQHATHDHTRKALPYLLWSARSPGQLNGGSSGGGGGGGGADEPAHLLRMLYNAQGLREAVLTQARPVNLSQAS
jgi:hypothetical protein